MAGNALPLLLVGGAAVVMMGGKKKRKSSSSRISGNYGDYSTAKPESINIQAAQKAIAKYPKQVWVIVVPGHPSNATITSAMKDASTRRTDMGFAVVSCELFAPYEGPEACKQRGGTWELRTSGGAVLQHGTVNASFGATLAGLIAPGASTPPRPGGATGSPTRPEPKPAPKPAPGVGPGAASADECDPLDPSTWGEGNICAMSDDGRWVKLAAASPQADNAGRAEMEALGYSEFLEPAGSLPLAIGMFQSDWNWFIDYIGSANPDINYEHPYTKIDEDGGWGTDTTARTSKALVKFDGKTPVYVEELDADMNTFRDMISALQALQGANA